MVKKILILSANPKNTDKLRIEEEEREIDEGLRRSRHRDEFDLTSKWAVRSRDFYRHMLDIQPHIVHFSGHGGGDNGIVLEDEAGKAQFLPTDQLTGLFKLFASKGVECVLLNACYSEVQAEAISQHVNYVIGMNRAIGDQAAVKFAVAFYDALGSGETVQFAYELGCTQLMGLKEHETPILKKRLGITAEMQLVDESRAVLSGSNLSTTVTNAQKLSSAPPDFESLQQSRQEMAANIDAEGDIEAGDMAQKAGDGDVVEQSMLKNVKGKNIKLGKLLCI